MTLLPSITCGLSTATLVAYTAYVARFSWKKSSFRNSTIARHNAPGLTVALLGTAGWLLLEYQLLWMRQRQVDGGYTAMTTAQSTWFRVLFSLWFVAFLGNTVTGFFMIPLLPNVDPATKREFISLVLCQLSVVSMFLGLVDVALIQPTKYACFLVSGIGIVFSTINFVLYLMDYMEGKSQAVCSGSYLVSEMRKQKEKRKLMNGESTVFHDYIAVCFQRGSEKTRMPANKTMLFIALTLIIPFPFVTAMALRFETIHTIYPQELSSLGLLSIFVMGTVGNMQVFHGTLSVRGKETVMRASAMVAWTVVVEILLVCTMFIHVMGIAGFADFVKFVFGLG